MRPRLAMSMGVKPDQQSLEPDPKNNGAKEAIEFLKKEK